MSDAGLLRVHHLCCAHKPTLVAAGRQGKKPPDRCLLHPHILSQSAGGRVQGFRGSYQIHPGGESLRGTHHHVENKTRHGEVSPLGALRAGPWGQSSLGLPNPTDTNPRLTANKSRQLGLPPGSNYVVCLRFSVVYVTCCFTVLALLNIIIPTSAHK